jgi:hypothetical protein
MRKSLVVFLAITLFARASSLHDAQPDDIMNDQASSQMFKVNGNELYRMKFHR